MSGHTWAMLKPSAEANSGCESVRNSGPCRIVGTHAAVLRKSLHGRPARSARQNTQGRPPLLKWGR
eukprot:8191073-Lingulodinium_polyedra.AAC.1